MSPHASDLAWIPSRTRNPLGSYWTLSSLGFVVPAAFDLKHFTGSALSALLHLAALDAPLLAVLVSDSSRCLPVLYPFLCGIKTSSENSNWNVFTFWDLAAKAWVSRAVVVKISHGIARMDIFLPGHIIFECSFATSANTSCHHRFDLALGSAAGLCLSYSLRFGTVCPNYQPRSHRLAVK